MRYAIAAVTVIWLAAGCDEGPGGTSAAIDDDRDAAFARSPNESPSPVRTVAIESGTREERILRNAASATRMQVELGRIAQRQAQDSRVKHFARRMFDDHQKAERDLLDAADAREIGIPPGLAPNHRTLLGQITPLVGSGFDCEYMRMMVSEHLGMVREYDEEARNGLDPHIRDFAERTLPTQRDHLDKARALADALLINVEDEEASVPAPPAKQNGLRLY